MVERQMRWHVRARWRDARWQRSHLSSGPCAAKARSIREQRRSFAPPLCTSLCLAAILDAVGLPTAPRALAQVDSQPVAQPVA